ncbi:transmembrane and immunoglobulin domain-containing protein 1 [Tachysurus fulvidraco]|uniref:transmembrane and immunoglobulin domain-containing protein 1 n=1 Tax=Tachysurus fulvidraco TaxID=1234273 RepID=UPI000F506D6B|nr:transmembrane and immunoglobulin domain-containing protein 1 [Tachysurus fulvidraco]XP_047661667.1 transmembrane and immunoglobulin domain-containing protein 1 [Tachysurus fulvidraco]
MRNSFGIRFILLAFVCVGGVYGTNVTIESTPLTNGGLIQTNPDQTVSLTCKVVDSAAPEELLWFRNGQQVSLKDGNRVNTSHVCVQPVSRNDNTVTFTCQLKSNVDVKASIQLEVRYPPTLGKDVNVSAEETRDTVLSCDVQAHPPVSVVWKKNGELMDLSSSNYKTSNNGFTATLSITNVNRDDHQGVYTCEADSRVYGVSKRSFRVTVVDSVMKFPLWPMVAGVVVIVLTILLAVISRWKKIMKCFKKD